MTRYDEIGVGYALGRRTDPRWLAPVLDALGDARSVLDVGSGTGSYEPPSPSCRRGRAVGGDDPATPSRRRAGRARGRRGAAVRRGHVRRRVGGPDRAPLAGLAPRPLRTAPGRAAPGRPGLRHPAAQRLLAGARVRAGGRFAGVVASVGAGDRGLPRRVFGFFAAGAVGLHGRRVPGALAASGGLFGPGGAAVVLGARADVARPPSRGGWPGCGRTSNPVAGRRNTANCWTSRSGTRGSGSSWRELQPGRAASLPTARATCRCEVYTVDAPASSPSTSPTPATTTR